MDNDLAFLQTSEFLIGALVAGVLLNVLSYYVASLVDRHSVGIPEAFRRNRANERQRVDELTAAAESSLALYTALSADAARLRSILAYRATMAFGLLSVAGMYATLLKIGVIEPAAIDGRVHSGIAVAYAFCGFYYFFASRRALARAVRAGKALHRARLKNGLAALDA